MQRIIIDYKKLTPEILALLNDKFPDGYGDDDIITFKNHNNETIDAVEVRTEDTIYLVKIGSHLIDAMANIDLVDDLDDMADNDDSPLPDEVNDEEE